jgi:succinate dehydrogenase / fumarate reductase iron-sulfur subunit
MQKRTFQIYRYDPDKDAKPYMQTIEIELDGNERMLLDALIKLKARTRRCRSAAPAAKASAVRTP